MRPAARSADRLGSILSITAPIFALIGLGYASVYFKGFTSAEMRVFGRYVINIALPALLFNAVAQRDFSEVMDSGYMLTVILAGVMTMGAVYGWFALQGTGPARRAIGAMGATVPNTGYIGYPVLLLVYPDLAGAVLAMNMVVENFLIIPTALILLELSRPREKGGMMRLIRELALSLLRRPLIIGLTLGMAVSLFGVPVPEALVRLLGLIAASAAPIALFVIGGTLVGLPTKGNRAMAAQIAGAKLLLHPALTALAMALLAYGGLPVPQGDFATAAILSAAIPMFSIFTVLSQEYGHEGLASLTLLFATTAAFFTLSALLYVLV